MNLNFKDLKRYEKQIILKNIGLGGQKKIFNSRILIIGVGGLGCPLLTYLVASGVGKLGIVDYDKVELSNLNRQTLFTINDIGKYKVDQAKAKVIKLNPKIKIKTFKKKINLNNIKSIIRDYDIICDGTDNYESRYLINDQSKKDKKVLISAAISRFDGHLYKFNFKEKSPCYRCFMPEKPKEENNCQLDGIFSPVAGIIGSLQANEVLKTILSFKSNFEDQVIIYNSIKNNFRKIKLSYNSACKNKCLK